jgi:hypothetical protein
MFQRFQEHATIFGCRSLVDFGDIKFLTHPIMVPYPACNFLFRPYLSFQFLWKLCGESDNGTITIITLYKDFSAMGWRDAVHVIHGSILEKNSKQYI